MISRDGKNFSEMLDEKINLISIDEVICRAKKLGVDFGNGDPKNRLRYYVKIGILPHAKRKYFNNHSPEGAYPPDIVWQLVEINKKIKEGKSIQTIKRELLEKEKEKELKEEKIFQKTFLPSATLYQDINVISDREREKVSSVISEEKEYQVEKKSKKIFRLSNLFGITFLILILFFTIEKNNIKNFAPSFLAAVEKFGKLAQLTPSFPAQENEKIFAFDIEPYLTINAETVINPSLSVKEFINTPVLQISKGDAKGIISTETLTADRNYTFPNQSGVVCLSSGNCVGLGGEIFAFSGTQNRLAKFISPNRISNSSINDLYNGVAITIASNGNVGIGIENPSYSLHVSGNIQATGDICTDLAGGRCLSRLILGGGGAPVSSGGINGSGTANYIPLWTDTKTLGNSILSQSGTTLSLAGDFNVSGLLSADSFKINTSTQPGYILVAADEYGNITFAPPPTGTIPSGTKFLRASIPILKFSTPGQTSSTNFVEITRKITTDNLEEILPSVMSGSERKFALLLKFSDDIPTDSSSTWQIDFDSASDFDFEFSGQALSSLDSGILHLKDEIEGLADDNWTLKVKVPNSANSIRVFSAFLLVYDQIQ